MQNLLNNTDTLVDVVGKMNAVTTEVAAQATTISEIAALLDGKSVPGGASVETRTLTYSMELLRGVSIWYTNASHEFTHLYFDGSGRSYSGEIEFLLGTPVLIDCHAFELDGDLPESRDGYVGGRGYSDENDIFSFFAYYWTEDTEIEICSDYPI